MRAEVIAHLSDLHFGAEDPSLTEPLAEDIAAALPTVVAVSGDVTQRAKPIEFAAAKMWLEGLPGAKVIVPGNHDVPLWDVLRRAVRPLERYRRLLDAETDPVWEDDRLLVIGVNTARSLTISRGRISDEQVASIRARLGADQPRRTRVLVAHHPFIPARHGLVGRGRGAIDAFASAGLDLVLAGHHHTVFAGSLGDWHVGLASSVLVSHASTALSHRRRGEANGWTRIAVTRETIAFDVREWNGTRFHSASHAKFRRATSGWLRAD